MGGTSPKFPALHLETALDRIKAFPASRADAVYRRSEVFALLGYEGKYGASVRTLNSVVLYGLLERIGSAYRVSALAKRALEPTSAADAAEAVRTAAWRPEIFVRLRERFPGGAGLGEEGVAYLEGLGFDARKARRLLVVYRRIDTLHGVRRAEERLDRCGSPAPTDAIRRHRDGERLFSYKMDGGAEILIELRGRADTRGVLDILTAWIAIKRDEIAGADRPRGAGGARRSRGDDRR